MTCFSNAIGPYVTKEIERSQHSWEKGEVCKEFKHLENAHVIGQESTYYHVYVHWKMLQWGIRQRSIKEVLGQVFRIAGAATKTAIGLVPQGNTGGSNVSPFRRMPIQPKLAKIIDHAKNQTTHSSL